MSKWWLGLAAGLAAAGLLIWRVQLPVSPPGALARLRQAGVIRLGYAVEAPYVFFDADRTLTGSEVEAAKIIVAQLGIPAIVWQQTEFGALLTELEAGRFDAVVAGVFITPERAQRVDFSEPTFHVGQALLVPAGNPDNLHAYEDFQRHADRRVAVLAGSVEAALLRELGLPDTQLIEVPDVLTGRAAVETGLAGGLALSAPTVHDLARQQALGRTEAAQPFIPPALPGARLTGYGAVVFRQTDADLRAAWNDQLRGFIGGAEHLRVLAGVGLDAGVLPGAVTTAAILAGDIP